MKALLPDACEFAKKTVVKNCSVFLIFFSFKKWFKKNVQAKMIASSNWLDEFLEIFKFKGSFFFVQRNIQSVTKFILLTSGHFKKVIVSSSDKKQQHWFVLRENVHFTDVL